MQQEPHQQYPTSSQANNGKSKSLKRSSTRKLRACDLCRRKKIRCDYDPLLPFNQCSSCRGYQKVCVFDEMAKKRGPPKGYVEGLETRLHRMEKLLMTMASSSNLSPEAIQQYINSDIDKVPISQDNIAPSNRQTSSTPTPTLESQSAVIKRLHQIDKSRQSHDAHMKEQLENAKEGKYAYLGSSSGVYMLKRLFRNGDDQPTPQTLIQGNEDDVMVARSGLKSSRLHIGPGAKDHMEGCFPSSSINSRGLTLPTPWKLPPKPVVDRLVELYFTEMNSFLPIVDEEEFMDKYRKGNTEDDGGVSTPLLMTICRVTIRILPADDPVKQAYKIDRAAVFWDIVQQFESNYQLDFMEPEIECIQILLLCSANADGWSPKSSNWLATSIAIKMAQDLGLHRSSSQWTLPTKRVEARERLWWSAYVVDRWVCASLGRPLAINDADCDLEYPKLENNGKYTSFVSIIKLSGILGGVLRAICSPRARTLGDQGSGPERILNQMKQALNDWRKSLPSSLWLDDNEMDHIHRQDISAELEAKINSGAGQLRILYNAVQLLSQRPAILLTTDQVNLQKVVAPQECLNVVKSILHLFYTIKFSSLLLVGWSLSSYGLSQALLFIFLNHRNEDEAVAEEAKQQAQTFRKHYLHLEHQFVETKLITFIDCITKKIQQDQVPSNYASDTSQNQKNDHTPPIDSLWGTSSGMDWHDIMGLLGE
ncbi:fungal-specific transcription factor domain-containing protein [Chlamydoabsidia padenii]|nr:fungal-specific transcription factor domain-containing protein [Chlamydoabsidia padenii]